MKYNLAAVVICIALHCSAAMAGTRLEENAQKLVAQYLTALTQGDTEFLLDVIVGDLLESRRTLLQNPSYPSYLIEAYTDASVSVTGSRQLTANSVEVDVVIEKAVDEQFKLTFLVKILSDKSEALRIVSELDAKK